MLDAAQTLDKFMRQDTPNPMAFDEVVGTLVARSPTIAACASTAKWSTCWRRAATTRPRTSSKSSGTRSAAASPSRCSVATPPATSAIRRPRQMLPAICAAHSHLHRKKDDLLAEFLLDQRAERRPAAPRLIHATIHGWR